MKKCRSCQIDIDAKAKKCPHCKVDQRSWFAPYPIITGILALIIFGLIGIVHVVSKNSGSSNRMQSEQNQPTPTSIRHDNSGAGADTGADISIQGHMQHALQHFGL